MLRLIANCEIRENCIKIHNPHPGKDIIIDYDHKICDIIRTRLIDIHEDLVSSELLEIIKKLPLEIPITVDLENDIMFDSNKDCSVKFKDGKYVVSEIIKIRTEHTSDIVCETNDIDEVIRYIVGLTDYSVSSFTNINSGKILFDLTNKDAAIGLALPMIINYDCTNDGYFDGGQYNFMITIPGLGALITEKLIELQIEHNKTITNPKLQKLLNYGLLFRVEDINSITSEWFNEYYVSISVHEDKYTFELESMERTYTDIDVLLRRIENLGLLIPGFDLRDIKAAVKEDE